MDQKKKISQEDKGAQVFLCFTASCHKLPTSRCLRNLENLSFCALENQKNRWMLAQDGPHKKGATEGKPEKQARAYGRGEKQNQVAHAHAKLRCVFPCFLIWLEPTHLPSSHTLTRTLVLALVVQTLLLHNVFICLLWVARLGPDRQHI